MHILFVKSNINSHSYGMDYGIGSLAAVLKQHGHTVSFYVVRFKEDFRILSYIIKETKPDVVGFSVYGSGFQSSVKISDYIRKQFPNLLQVMGGVHLILSPHDIENAPSVDAVCTGEGEYAFLDFLKRYSLGDDSYLHTSGFWTRKKGKIYKNPGVPFVKNIEELPFPDREIFAKQAISPNYDYYDGAQARLEYLFTRGCPFNCSYCSNHALRAAFGQNHVRRLTPERAVEWIREDLKHYACDQITIHDDTFTLDKEWTMRFLDLYKEIKIPFRCNLRVGTFDRKLLLKMKNAGCVNVCIGLESGDEDLRINVMKRNMTNKDIVKTFDFAKELKLDRFAFVMMGLPAETPRKLINTIKLLGRVSPEAYILGIFYPYKGTDLYNYVKERKYISHKQKWDFIERADTILNMPQFSRRDILYYYNNFPKLLSHLRETKLLPLRVHKRYKFELLAVPPSSKFFVPAQIMYKIDEFICYSALLVKDMISLSFSLDLK